MKTKILLTFDYELYFGENFFSEKEVLFDPTSKLLNKLKVKNIKAVFFIDICSIIAYKKNNKYEYIKKFKSQVEEMKSFGHDIQMHFHPHWTNSIFNEKRNSWDFDHDNYSYSNLIDNFGLSKANEIFLEAHNQFVDLVGYSPTVFRAGGYSIQPYEKELIELLISLDYTIDTSITPYKKYVSDAQYFDFLKCEELNIWNVSSESFLKKGKKNLIEIPVLSIKKSFFNLPYYAILRLINKFYQNIKFNRRGKGASLNLKEYKNNSLQFGFDMVSKKNIKIIKFITSQYIHKYKNNDIVYLNILSHPKALFNESFDVIEWYINYMKKKYKSDFICFNDISRLNEN